MSDIFDNPYLQLALMNYSKLWVGTVDQSIIDSGSCEMGVFISSFITDSNVNDFINTIYLYIRDVKSGFRKLPVFDDNTPLFEDFKNFYSAYEAMKTLH